ncbi:MAG: hypothetical protein GF315_11980 [candidate division Zixibacteria bacterium]|nr:hypothetical protein [candidate division Zixibacteria bacterium]
MHYGSLMGEMDYKTVVNSFSAGFTFLGIKRTVFTVSGNMVMGEAEFDPVNMPEVSDEAEQELEAANFDYSEVNTYSDLSYNRLDLTLGADYSIDDETTFSAELIYINFADDEVYVYGDQTGSLYVIRAGVTFGLR